MNKTKTYPVPAALKKTAHVDFDAYQRMYRESVDNPDVFWGKMATDMLHWFKKWEVVSNCNFIEPRVEWFKGGLLNVSYNCVDRHLATKGDKIAIIGEPDNPSDAARYITYKELHLLVNKFANVLLSLGVTKGDRVCLYMPMVPEAAVAMLACSRIGAVHSVVFAGFSAEALHNRIADSACKVVITADEGVRGGKTIPLKHTVDEALAAGNPSVQHVVVLKRTGANVNFQQGRDVWYHHMMEKAENVCAPVQMDATDPLFILYTSGSTGKPKGVVHGTGGYLLYAATTFKYVFDYHNDDVYWCTADVGWITGHSYVVYGPLANGATTVMFEGVPQYPDWSRFWQVADKHNITILYTAPTAIRAIEAQGNEWVHKTSRKSLRILASVGEPLNPEAWNWYHSVVGEGRCRIIDTWWQTETGGHMITPLPGATPLKAGSTTLPFFGVVPMLVDEKGLEISGAGEGMLCIARSWPGQMITVYGDHERFKQTYFATFKGKYFSGDGCRRDEDGYFWITGRVDDIINVSGHRIGTAEVESALVLHPHVSEAAVVGVPHNIKGEAIYAYVTLHKGAIASDELIKELVALCVKEIGAIAKPEVIQWAPALPKTRSGKIMRRILRKIAAKDTGNLGDISTLADPSVVAQLIEERAKIKVNKA